MTRHLFLLLLFLPAPLFGAVGPTRPEPADLIRQLGDASYLTREEAARRLVALGPQARPALTQGLKSKDPEIRARCRELLPLLGITDQDRQLGAFLQTGNLPKMPLPGWKAYSAVAGTDLTARLLYADLYQKDRDLLAQLERNPGGLAGQFQTRLSKLQQRLQPFGNVVIIGGVGGGVVRVPQPKKDKTPVRAAELAAVLLISQASSGNPVQFQQLNSLFYNPAAVDLVHSNHAVRRLLARHLSAHARDINQLASIAYVARNLQLQEFLQGTVKPLLIREAEQASKRVDLNKLSQIASIANQLDLIRDLPASMRKAAVDAARSLNDRPEQISRYYQVQNLLTALRMQDTLEEVVKPIVVKMAQKMADGALDYNRFNQVMYMAQAVRADEALKLLEPAACKLVVQAANNPSNLATFQQALYLSQRLNLTAARETLLRPAARKRVLEVLERPLDINQLTQLNNLCTQLDLGQMSHDTLKPALEKRLPEIVQGVTSAQQLMQANNLAQQLGLKNAVEKAIKPALKKLVARKTLPAQVWEIQPLLQLAANLNVREASSLALEAAKSSRVHGHLRGSSILFVGEFGTQAEAGQLESLLKDSTQVGAFSANGQMLQTQVRDIALAVLVKRNKQALRDYGFSEAFNGGQIRFTTMPASYGFASPEAREKAHARWAKSPRS